MDEEVAPSSRFADDKSSPPEQKAGVFDHRCIQPQTLGRGLLSVALDHTEGERIDSEARY
jgi:hypothetical protein